MSTRCSSRVSTYAVYCNKGDPLTELQPWKIIRFYDPLGFQSYIVTQLYVSTVLHWVSHGPCFLTAIGSASRATPTNVPEMFSDNGYRQLVYSKVYGYISSRNGYCI